MEINSWSAFLLPYEQAVAELLMKFRSLKHASTVMGKYTPIESVNGRVKSIKSILDKMQKKTGSVRDVTTESIEAVVEDIAGIRLICRFVDDIDKVMALVEKRTDMTILKKKDYLGNQKKSGYRSLHLIISYVVQTVKGPQAIKAEIQIRTMSMNFWAATEHSLQYKYRGEMPAHITEKLQRVSDVLAELDEEMSSVRDEIIDAQLNHSMHVQIVREILRAIENMYSVTSKREVKKIQDEFYEIYSKNDIQALILFAKHLDIMTESYRVQSVDSTMPKYINGD